MNKMKIKIFTLLSLLITFSLTLSSCDSLWDDLNTLPKYTITYNSNNGTGTMEPQIFEENVPQALSENKFTREGYTFAGWATKADASTAEYADKASFTATKNITLYAIWSVIPPVPSKYTITYNSNSGSGTMEPQIFEENVPQALSENKFTRENYTFAGWATKADASEAEYADKANYTATKDITLYAIWSVIPPTKYTITYVSAYGSKPANKEVDKGYTLTSSDLPDLGETEDKYFDKWDITVGTEITADTRITATWDDIVYLKTFTNIDKIKNNKTEIERIIFTTDSTDSSEAFDCSDTAGYFTGVLENNILTIYGNGHRIYAPTICKQFFSGFSKLASIEFNNFYTSKVTDMTGMFASCKALTSLNVSSFDTSAVTNMTGMFNYLENITELNLSNFDTSKVENMQNMFQSCKKLTSVNVSSFNTSAVTNMSNMFYNCNELLSLDVSKFITASVTNMKQMFASCYKLTELDLSSFDTSAVEWTSMGGQGTNIFTNCSSLVTIYATEKFNPANKKLGIFDGCTNLVGGAGTKYSDAEISDPDHYKTALYARIDGGSSNPGYFTLKQ